MKSITMRNFRLPAAPRIFFILIFAALPLMTMPFPHDGASAGFIGITGVTETMTAYRSARLHINEATVEIRRYTCPAGEPHLVNWQDDSTGTATCSEWAFGGDGTSDDPDWVEVLHGGGVVEGGASVSAEIWCSELWWPTIWECGAEGQPVCWGAVQAFLPGTPQQGWMQPEFMFYANGNGLCDDGLGAGAGADAYRCVDLWGQRHQRDSATSDWEAWAWDNQRYGISGREPINWQTTIGTHESFNSFADGYAFPNQNYSLYDQLNLGARYIDLRARWIDDYLRLSHTTGNDSTTGGTGGDRAFLYAIHEINLWLEENPDQVIMLEIGVGTDGAAAPSTAYINDVLDRYLGDKILTPPTWCYHMLTNHPSVLRANDTTGTQLDDCGGFATYVPPRWPTTTEMLDLGRQVIVFTNGGGLGQRWSFDDAVSTGNSLDGTAGYSNGFARDFDASTCTRDGVQYLYNSNATPTQRDFYNRAFTTEEEARPFGQAQFAFDSWPGYLMADADDIQRVQNDEPQLAGVSHSTDMTGITNCNVSLMKLDMLGEPGWFHGSFVQVDGLDDRRNGVIWSWAPGDWGTSGGATGNNAAMLSPTDNRWHSTNITNQYRFACAKPRSGDPTTWPDVLQETWKITSGTGAWEEGFAMCKSEFGAQGLVFSSSRNGRANQLLIQARDDAGLQDENIWLGYSDAPGFWTTDAPPSLIVTLTHPPSGLPYTSGEWTNQPVDIQVSGVDNNDPPKPVTIELAWTGASNAGFSGPSPLALPWGVFEGTTTFSATAVTESGMRSRSQVFIIKQDATPPVLSFTHPETVPEGSAITFDASASTDALSGIKEIVWDNDGDGVFDDADPSTYTPTDNGVYKTSVRVSDHAVNSVEEQAQVNITNADPVAEDLDLEVTPSPSTEGHEVSLSVSFTDAGTADTHTCKIFWGDGSPQEDGTIDQENMTCTGAHTYIDENAPEPPYRVDVTIEDDDGGSVLVRALQSVTNVAPTVETPVISESPSAEGRKIAVSAPFTDPGINDTHTCEVDFGDGSDPADGVVSGNNICTVAHTYIDDIPPDGLSNPYTIKVTVTDDSGDSGETSIEHEVLNVAPTVNTPIVIPNPSNEAQEVSVSASFTDPGANDTHTCEIDWGDGTPKVAGTVESLTCTGTHTYADDNPSNTASDPYTVTVEVTDNSGDSGENSATQLVNNVAPTITLIDIPPVNDHASMATVSVTATDPGGDGDPLTYAFDCDGNGSYETATGSAGVVSCFPDPTTLSPTIGVQVSDDDLGITTGAVELHVRKHYCASFYTRNLRDSIQCQNGEFEVVLEPGRLTYFCANAFTGRLVYGGANCSANWIPLLVPAINSIPVCEEIFTGGLNYRFGQPCTVMEFTRIIPAS